LAKTPTLRNEANKSFVINAGALCLGDWSSVRTAAECNVGGEQVKPAARAADIFCPYRNGSKMMTGYRILE
jgi:hypothetical protein